MKILKIFGIVVGVHVFALVLIFANPGCSSSSKQQPAPIDTVNAAAPGIYAPDSGSPTGAYAGDPLISPAPISFDPDAPAVAASAGSSPGVRFTPTRPGTPAATTLVAEPVVDVTPATTYTVKSGDSLWTIARRNHLTVAQLTAANGLRSNAVLRPGQKLLIPGKPASPTVAATANPAESQGKTAKTVAPKPSPVAAVRAGSLKHTVKSGETLSVIARNYGVKPGDIAVANNIADPAKILAGTDLIIPGWETPASKKAGNNGSVKSGPAPAPKSDSTSTPQTIQLEPESSAEPAPPEVPVIRIDDGSSPITPAPKN